MASAQSWFFQFSLWDSLAGRSLYYEKNNLSILFMRFYRICVLYVKGEVRLSILFMRFNLPSYFNHTLITKLSILFMRFKTTRRDDQEFYCNFQFSLWDSSTARYLIRPNVYFLSILFMRFLSYYVLKKRRKTLSILFMRFKARTRGDY